MKLVMLPVASLEVCDRTRVRHQKPKDGSDIVLEYAEAYQCGLITEPLDVFHECGTRRYVVADGEHRLLALRRASVEQVECRIHEGDEIDALRFATGCNKKHGLRRTKADIYHAFCRIMETKLRDEFRTDTQLSEQLGISVATVQRYKADWRNSDGGNKKAKAAAQQQAAKHPGRPRADLSPDKSKEPQKQKLTPEQKQVAAQVRESVKPQAPKEAGDDRPDRPISVEPISASPKEDAGRSAETASRQVDSVSEFLSVLSTFRTLPPAAQFRSSLSGHIDWKQVEYAHEWLTQLLAER